MMGKSRQSLWVLLPAHDSTDPSFSNSRVREVHRTVRAAAYLSKLPLRESGASMLHASCVSLRGAGRVGNPQGNLQLAAYDAAGVSVCTWQPHHRALP